ncbi:hypothetical protein [Microcoleus sp. Pol14C4]
MPMAIANSFETLLKVDRTLPDPNQILPLDIPTLTKAIIKTNTVAAGINTIIELCPAN